MKMKLRCLENLFERVYDILILQKNEISVNFLNVFYLLSKSNNPFC